MNEKRQASGASRNRWGNIGLKLDSYIDIFSSFDPRPYSYRSLSIDFINELKRAVKEKTSEEMQVILLVPEDKRDSGAENVIKKRLREYFRKHTESVKEEKLKVLMQGIYFVIF